MDIDQRLDRLKERYDALLRMMEAFNAWKRASMERLESPSRDWAELSQRMAAIIERLNRFGHTMLSPNNIDAGWRESKALR